MGVNIKKDGKVLTAEIIGDIDHHSAKDIRETIDKEAQMLVPTVLNLDFSNVKFMDSSGIGLIMGRYKLMKVLKGELEVINMSPGIERIIKLSGLLSLNIVKQKI